MLSMNLELSPQHDALVAALYDLRDRFSAVNRNERLILEAAIQMLEFMPWYKKLHDREEPYPWTPEAAVVMAASVPKRESRIEWNRDDFADFIASGGCELLEGKLVPKL